MLHVHTHLPLRPCEADPLAEAQLLHRSALHGFTLWVALAVIFFVVFPPLAGLFVALAGNSLCVQWRRHRRVCELVAQARRELAAPAPRTVIKFERGTAGWRDKATLEILLGLMNRRVLLKERAGKGGVR